MNFFGGKSTGFIWYAFDMLSIFYVALVLESSHIHIQRSIAQGAVSDPEECDTNFTVERGRGKGKGLRVPISLCILSYNRYISLCWLTH